MSIPFKIKGNQGLETRLGVEDDYFVVLHEHRLGFFHGNIATWDDLPEHGMQTALYNAGIVKNIQTGRM